MTLYRQLLFFTVIMFCLLFAGVWLEKLHSTRSFLFGQLESNAQDTATSLGLSLSPVMADQDIPTVETMMNAVFDRGYFRIIRLERMDGEVIIEKSVPVKSEGVPDWFVRLVPLEPPVAESLVMAGWKQAGRLLVESHPGYAYKTLWQTAVQISIYFLLFGLSVLLLGGLGLRLLLRPLKQVEQQAEAICRREYHLQQELPRTRELRQVVESMNRMTAKVRDMFSEQSKLAERLQASAYSDPLTGLGNRRYLGGQVGAGLRDEGGVVRGALLLVEVNGLQQLNEELGYVAGDELLKKVAGVLRQEAGSCSNAAVARLNGGSFAIFLPRVSAEDAEEVAEQCAAMLARLAMEDHVVDDIVSVGGVVFTEATSLPHLLASADSALGMARKLGPNRWQVNRLEDGVQDAVKGRSWWKEALDRVLAEKGIVLYSQTIVSSRDRGEVLHLEILSRIALAPGEIVSAGIFVPLAERLQMISRLDRIVLEKVFVLAEKEMQVGSVAVNVSPSSLNDRTFYDWVIARLASFPSPALKFVFEFAEFGSVLYLDVVREFSAEIRRMGHGIALDHFGQSFSNFGYLKSLKPEYVKIDKAYTEELKEENGDSHFFIGALCGVAHSLDILVIAEGVETEEQAAIFRDLNVDALQGFLISRPGQVEDQ